MRLMAAEDIHQGWTPPAGTRGLSVFILDFQGGFRDTLEKKCYPVLKHGPKARGFGTRAGLTPTLLVL